MKFKYVKDFEFPADRGFRGSNKMPSKAGASERGMPARVGKAVGAPRMESKPKMGKGQGYAEGGMTSSPLSVRGNQPVPVMSAKPMTKSQMALKQTMARQEARKARLAEDFARRKAEQSAKISARQAASAARKAKPAMISPAAKRVEYIANETGQYDPSRGSGAGAVMMPSVEGQMQQVMNSPLKPYAKGGSVKGKKVAKVMREYKEGKLHSGSKKGPVVKNPKQAMAIALSEAGASKKAKGGIFNDEDMAYESKGPKTRGTARKGREQGRRERRAREAMERAEKYAPGLSLDMSEYKKGGKVKHSDVKMDKAMMKSAVHKHERAMHPGKPLTKLRRGGVPSYGRKAMYGGGKC